MILNTANIESQNLIKGTQGLPGYFSGVYANSRSLWDSCDYEKHFCLPKVHI